MDTAAQWPQKGIGLVESNERQPQSQAERRLRPQKEHPINCPRCDSSNTKFCYYNNYSLSQPRYFCKTCRRYWTAGGTLRNVPVGGGSRKNKRSSFSSSTTTAAATTSSSSSSSPNLPSSTAKAVKAANQQPSQDLIHLAYKLYHGAGHDLNLPFPIRNLGGCNSISEGGQGQFVPEPGSLFGAGLGFRELMGPVSSMKMQPLISTGVNGGDGRLLFPFEDLNHVSMINGSGEGVVQGQHGDPTFFWNGGMGNGAAGNGGSW